MSSRVCSPLATQSLKSQVQALEEAAQSGGGGDYAALLTKKTVLEEELKNYQECVRLRTSQSHNRRLIRIIPRTDT